MPDAHPAADRIVEVLALAGRSMNLRDICRAAFGRVGEREMNRATVAIHRLGDRIVKHPRTYELRRT